MKKSEIKTYFITGATGVIGCALIPLLLLDKNTVVRLLIRAKDPHQLDERTLSLFKFWGYVADQVDILKRIQTFRGDISLPRFGLDQTEYDRLTYECNHIIHCAGNVKMNLPLEEARNSAVNSTHNIFEFATKCNKHGNLEKIEFVSTVGVGGRNHGLIPEEWITNEREFHNTYEQSKAEAEIIVAQHIKKGLPITIHRPSMVVGDSKTGRIIHFQIFYHLCEFLSGIRTHGIIPKIKNATLDIIPVDYVAHAIALSCKEPSTIGQILHLCSGPEKAIIIHDLAKKINSIFKTYSKKSPKLVPLNINLFELMLPVISLLSSQKTKRALTTLPMFLNYLSDPQFFSNSKTTTILEPLGITVPTIDNYLDKIIVYYFQQKR